MTCFILLDPRPRMQEAPYTFFLPSQADLAAVATGDIVQLLVEHVPQGLEWDVERMWFIVESVDGDRLSARLDNDPSEATATIKADDVVSFARHQILSIISSDPATAPASVQYRTYWDRCMVDACVLDGIEPVEFVYREEPDMTVDGDRDPDSGWRIRGRAGEASDEEIDARAARYVALGAVLNRDDSWLHLIDAPVESRLRRNNSGVYVAEA